MNSTGLGTGYFLLFFSFSLWLFFCFFFSLASSVDAITGDPSCSSPPIKDFHYRRKPRPPMPLSGFDSIKVRPDAIVFKGPSQRGKNFSEGNHGKKKTSFSLFFSSSSPFSFENVTPPPFFFLLGFPNYSRLDCIRLGLISLCWFFLLGFTRCYWVWACFDGFYLVLSCFTEFFLVLLGLLCFTCFFFGFYLVLPSFTGFY